jgi:lysozyme
MSRSRLFHLVAPVLLAVSAASMVAAPALAGGASETSQPASVTGAAMSASPNAPSLISGPGYRHGIDVSHWQGKVRWERVADAGVDFVIAKATQGTWFVDDRYERNRTNAQSNGLKFTAYHFAEPGSRRLDAVREADHFVDTAQLGPRNLIPVLDLEITGGLGPKALQSWALAWLKRVEERLGVKPMIYSSPAFWKYRVGDSALLASKGYRVLWIAHYETPRPSVPAQRWDGAGWTLWQWTECGHVSGIDGCVDRNSFNGTDLWRLKIRNQRQAQ